MMGSLLEVGAFRKPNVTKVRINFSERAHPVFGCEFYWYSGKQHNFERGKNYVKCTNRPDGRAGQVNFCSWSY